MQSDKHLKNKNETGKITQPDAISATELKKEDHGGVKKNNNIVYGLITAKEAARFVPCQQTTIVREGGVL